MKPDEHLPRIHGDQPSEHDTQLSEGEQEDRPSPLERHFARGRSQVSTKASSHSSMGTPTKLPCIDGHSQSVTSVFSLRDTSLAKQKVLAEERCICRSPSCPNLPVQGQICAGAGDEDDLRLPALKSKTLTRRPSMQKDFNLISESHRRLKARGTIAAPLATVPKTRRPVAEEEAPLPKNAMLLPLRDSGPPASLRKPKVSSDLPPAQRKKDRKRKTLSPELHEEDHEEKLDISHSDMKCLIWLAEVKANQSDLKEVT